MGAHFQIAHMLCLWMFLCIKTGTDNVTTVPAPLNPMIHNRKRDIFPTLCCYVAS